MCTTCNCFKHKSKDIYYTASRSSYTYQKYGAPMQSLRSVPTNILHNTVMVCLQQLALLVQTLRPTRWQQSSSELSACWMGCSASVWAAWLTARRNCSVSYALLSNRDTHTLHCCSKSLKQYSYNFECGVRYVFGFVRKIITCHTH